MTPACSPSLLVLPSHLTSGLPAGNFTIASSIDTLAQAMTLGDKNGVSREV
jgi:hypothetical protein